MNDRQQTRRLISSAGAMLAVSAALNLALATWLVRSELPLPGALAGFGPRHHTRVVRTVPIPAAHPVLGSVADTDGSLAFDWRQVESADYRQYIANLRALGCPEQVIRDIIAADLEQTFSRRAAGIWQRPAPQPYWRKYRRDEPGPGQLKALAALSREQSAAYKALLGVPLNQQQIIDTLLLQLYGPEQQLLFLPPDRHQAALAALTEANADAKDIERGDYAGHDPEHFAETMKTLAEVLSADELTEFRLRGSPSADQLRTELQYFNCTREEFKTLLDLRDKDPRSGAGDLLNRTAATEQVRQLFGDDRAKEFERVTDLFYINARRAAEVCGLPAELADQAWQLALETRAAADRLARDGTLSADERQRQIAALRDGADARLADVLGPKAARSVSAELRFVLDHLAPPPHR